VRCITRSHTVKIFIVLLSLLLLLLLLLLRDLYSANFEDRVGGVIQYVAAFMKKSELVGLRSDINADERA